MINRTAHKLIFLLITIIGPVAFGANDPVDPSTTSTTKVCLDETNYCLIKDNELFKDSWDVLPQVVFWKEIMELSPDSSLINEACSRTILCKIHKGDYSGLGDSQKSELKDSLRKCNGIQCNSKVYVTRGKSHFYKFDEVLPNINQSIPVFEEQDVDPWFAQAILLIESPGQLKKSSVGAYGGFQIMPGVARKYGLVVNKYRDDRKDLKKSAKAAAGLIKGVCIPYAKSILEKHDIAYQESDLFFKLLVLHIYHAGAGNVMKAVDKLNPSEGGTAFIKGLWQTSAGGFKNASQNYSQVALAAMVILHERQHINK